MSAKIFIGLLVITATAGVSIFIYFAVSGSNKDGGMTNSTDFSIVSRDDWHANPPKSIEVMPNPVPFVVIHHSYIPAACNTSGECIEAMQWMQDFHQNNRSWADIGYHFAVGGDGRAYEGRGWSRVGAHAPGYNNISIGICVIGDWRVELPPQKQLEAVHKLIRKGVDLGMIREDYLLVGHKQVREGTECPGDRLFREIADWDHFVNLPKKKEKEVKIEVNKIGEKEKEQMSGYIKLSKVY